MFLNKNKLNSTCFVCLKYFDCLKLWIAGCKKIDLRFLILVLFRFLDICKMIPLKYKKHLILLNIKCNKKLMSKIEKQLKDTLMNYF